MRTKITLLLLFIVSLSACTNIEGSAEKVFSNANDALKPQNHTVLWEQADEDEK